MNTQTSLPTLLRGFFEDCVATRNCRLVAVPRFFAYVAETDPQHADLCRRVLDIPVKKTASSAMTYLDRQEIKALLAAPLPAQRLGRRDIALLTFLYNTGARASEVVALNVKDVRFDPPNQVRIFGKGRRNAPARSGKRPWMQFGRAFNNVTTQTSQIGLSS